jgi:hypothetical protein
MLFQCHYNQRAEPFRWNCTRAELAGYVKRMEQRGCLPGANPLPN